MPPTEVPPIGERIREERVRRDRTLRGLAREVGVSPSLISQIETGKSQPSVSTLYAITTALELPIDDLFAPADGGNGDRGDRPPAIDGTASTLAPLAATVALAGGAAPPRSRTLGPVVRADGRERLQLESGVTWELLGQVPGEHVEFLRATYPPGSSSAGAGQLMRHAGTEFGYLVAGQLTLSLGAEEHPLGPGDAFSFASDTPHSYRNDGDEPAVGIWFVLETG